jgi:hypothetical protein
MISRTWLSEHMVSGNACTAVSGLLRFDSASLGRRVAMCREAELAVAS